jgi:hypothetical protein
MSILVTSSLAFLARFNSYVRNVWDGPIKFTVQFFIRTRDYLRGRKTPEIDVDVKRLVIGHSSFCPFVTLFLRMDEQSYKEKPVARYHGDFVAA